jgi:hypothetical protein
MADKPTTGDQLPNSIARAWYGPGTFIPPIATPGTEPRTRDYVYNTNINYAKRKYERVSFDQLRELSTENYLIRVILEKVKQRLATIRWEFRLRSQDPGEHLASIRQRSNKDTRIKWAYKFFERPDGQHDWPEWLNATLEDRYVLDAATWWVERDSKDNIAHLVPIDGSTINLLTDARGMIPAPPYAAYQQLVKGMPAVNFTTEDLMYMPSNYRAHKLFGFGEVEQTIRIGQTQIQRAIWTLNHYTEGNIPELLLLFKGADYTAKQIEEYMHTFEASLNGQLDQRQRAYALPDANVHELRGKELYDAFDEWLARIFCYQMGEPPTSLVKAVNRASAQEMDDNREEVGEKPAINWIRTKLNRFLQDPMYMGWDDVEAVHMDAGEIDALKQAQIDFINVPLGITSVDEARVRDGKAPETPEQKEERQTAARPVAPGDAEEEDGAGPQKAAGLKKKALRLIPSPSPLAGSKPGKSYAY